jgi:hypothetical protein
VRERAVIFGSHGGLVGVFCEPGAGPSPDLPAAVFSNVGLHHRVGPNRVWVELARELARGGYASLRFDLSGLGDSEPRRDTLSDSERAVLDLREALDHVERISPARRFVLVANCSGVDNLHAVAVADPRVVGAVYVDGYAYRNAGYAWRRQATRLFQFSRWKRRLRNRRGNRVARGIVEVWKRDIPTREQFAADLGAMVRRGVRLLFAYTSGADQRYNYRGQFHDMFGFEDAVQVFFYPRADHILSRTEDRARLGRDVLGWMRSHFPPRPAAATWGSAKASSPSGCAEPASGPAPLLKPGSPSPAAG